MDYEPLQTTCKQMFKRSVSKYRLKSAECKKRKKDETRMKGDIFRVNAHMLEANVFH